MIRSLIFQCLLNHYSVPKYKTTYCSGSYLIHKREAQYGFKTLNIIIIWHCQYCTIVGNNSKKAKCSGNQYGSLE